VIGVGLFGYVESVPLRNRSGPEPGSHIPVWFGLPVRALPGEQAGGDGSGIVAATIVERVAQSTAITAVAPSDLTAAAGAQALHLTGTGFQPGLTLTLTDPTNSSTKVATAAILLVEPTLVSANVTLQMAGSWKVTVTNPGSTVAATFPFTVKGKPTIEGPATVTKDPAPQKVTFVGKGFMSGLTVSLTPPGAAATTLNATTVTATSVVVTATLPNAGDGQVVITNPENKASDAFAFKVS
jgi:hypothetical protein